MQEEKLLTRKRKATREGNKNLLASTCIDLAELYSNEGRHEDAIDEYIIVADVYKEMGKQLDYARANRMIGETYTHLREYDKALRYQQIYLNVAKEQNDKLEEQRAFATIGRTHLTSYLDIIDNPDKTPLNLAYKSFMKSLVLCESLTGVSKRELKDITTRLLANLGVVEECQGNYNKGIELVQKSINTCKSHDLFEQLEHSYTLLGSLYVRKREYNKAINQYNLAIEAAGRLKNKISLMCASLSAKADILITLADFHGAKTVLLKAYKLKNPCHSERKNIEQNLKIVAAMCYAEDSLLTVSDSDYNTKKHLYEKLGDGACSLKNYSIAVEYYQKMLDAAKDNGDYGLDLSPCYISLAETYRDNKQFDLAIKFFKEDLKLPRANSKDSITTLLNIADCTEAAGKNIVAIEGIYDQARNECITSGEKRLEFKVLSRHIAVLRKNGRLAQVAQLERELSEMNFVTSESESEHSEEQATPNIGDDISLSNITDLSDDSDTENCANKPRTARKRAKGLVIKKNAKGETQLHTACISGKAVVVRHLLDQGHIVNIRDNAGWLPIHEACIHGYIDIVEMLIEKGASINDRGGTECKGVTPLHDAALNGHLEVMQLLLDKGALSIAKNDFGEMPLHVLQKWRTLNELDPASQSIYNNIVERLGRDMEKSGHAKDVVMQDENNTAVELENAPIKRRISTEKMVRKTTVEKNKNRIGSLRRNIGFDEDLDLNASTSKTPCSEDSESNDDDSKTNSNIRDEYKRVMQSMKYPLREENVEKKRKSNEKSHRAAHLEPEEVGDDWLEDDLIVNQHKKRKTSTEPLVNTTEIRKDSSGSMRCRSSSSLKSKESFSDGFEVPDRFFNSDFDVNEIHVENKNVSVVNIDSDDEFVSSKRNLVNKKRKSQSSLIDQGFTRNRSFSPTNLVANTNSGAPKRKHQTKLTTFGHTRNAMEVEVVERTLNDGGINQNGSCSLNRTFNSELTWAVDVRIDGKLYRVPVLASETHTRTMKWLADEAAKRYSRKECLKPTLELETKNGAVLAEDDFLSILFSAGTSQAEEIVARIIKWNLPPLFDRYNKACTNLNLIPNESLAKILQEASTSLDASNMALRNNLAPLCKAINRQINLHHVNLSGNFMLNDAVQLLCASLPSLDNLTVLNLSLNQITADSLAVLADMFTQSSKSILENLVSLDLSYNPLGDESLKYLAIITRYLKLQTLNLTSVDFTGSIFNIISNRNVNFCLDFILNFDIGYNKLSKQEIMTFLSWLKPQNIEKLNIAGNVAQEDGLTKEVVNWLESRGNNKLNLKALDLSWCRVTDTEVFELLRVLFFADNLAFLNLSYNENLTTLSLRRLMQHQPSIANLDLSGCENILKYFEDCTESTWSCAKIKLLRLSVNGSVNSRERDVLVNMWKSEHKEKARISDELQGFLELCICE